MAQKTQSKKFNVFAGKIINVADFESALGEALKERKGLAKIKGSITSKVRNHRRKGVSLADKTWPVVYTRDTAAETAQALAEMKQWPVTIQSKDKPPVTKTFGELYFGEPAGPIIEDHSKIPTACVPVKADKTYFEASSLMATVNQEGCMSKAFKEAIKKCADRGSLLTQNILSEAHDPNDSGYNVSLNIDTGKVTVEAFVVPEGNYLNTRVLGGKSISIVRQNPYYKPA